MKKVNEEHPVHIVLRNWLKIHKADAHVVAEKHARKETKKNGRS